jgi:hypothetical protein
MGDTKSKEYFDKFKIVERFCGGDVDMAKSILKGELNDVIVFKGRFKNGDETLFGLFMVLVHETSSSVIDAYSVVSGSSSVFRHKPYDDWRTFISRIKKEGSDMGEDERTNNFTVLLKRIHELKLFSTFFEGVRKNDIAGITENFKKIVGKFLSDDSVSIVIDFEESTTLILHEELGITPG